VHRQLDQKEKIVQEKRKIVRDAEDITEVSPWLERTQWIRHLEGQDKATMAQLVKPAQDNELKLQAIEKSFERLVKKAQQTIVQKKVSTFILHRVESFQVGEDSQKPFHVNLVTHTIEQYQRVWRQLLVYVLRTADSELWLYELTPTQECGILQVLWTADQLCNCAPADLEEEEIETIQQELDKYCLELCMRLLDHRLDHDEYESTIISYLAVAALEFIPGNSISSYRFKDSSQYTPILSGFIKVAQMLVVQYCFEKEEEGEVESCRRLLEQLHTRFMTVGTATPMD
jgi:hypothetical protein